MSIVKEKILFTGLDINLSIMLDSKNTLIGSQQSIDGLVESTKNELINPVIDTEVRRFEYDSSIDSPNLKFYFYNPLNGNVNTFQSVGFTTSEIVNNNLKLLNSFYVMEVYDTYNPYTQSKISTNYVSKILSGEYDNSDSYKIPYYRMNVNNKNQFYYLHLPQSFINNQTGNTAIVYIKFMFYNAINGSINVFYCKRNESLTTQEKMYFKVKLNLINNTWKFINTPDTYAYELNSTSNYVKRVENTVKNIDNIKQNYPTGNTFQRTTGSYTEE